MRSIALALALLLAAVAAPALTAVAAPTATATWTAPTTNVDNSAISGTITYNLYQGLLGSPAKPPVQTGLTSTTATVVSGLVAGTTQCFAVSAVVGGVESAVSPAACVAIPVPAPNSPTQLTVVVR